jgi:hypothetical protein
VQCFEYYFYSQTLHLVIVLGTGNVKQRYPKIKPGKLVIEQDELAAKAATRRRQRRAFFLLALFLKG